MCVCARAMYKLYIQSIPLVPRSLYLSLSIARDWRTADLYFVSIALPRFLSVLVCVCVRTAHKRKASHTITQSVVYGRLFVCYERIGESVSVFSVSRS